MNKQFKFRVWSVEDKRFLDSYADQGLCLYYPVRDNSVTNIVGVHWFIECERNDNPKRFYVQQFTGILDINGREIYSGDIVKYTEKLHEHGDACDQIAEVFYESDCGCYVLGRAEAWAYFPDEGYSIHSLKILGNIFENPELLKG